MRGLRLALVIGAGLMASAPAAGFELEGPDWPDATATFHVSIPGGGLWDTAFEDAMASWNEATDFAYLIERGSFSDPCTDFVRNGVAFTADACGVAFGATTLAIAFWITNGGGDFTDTDIVFNNNLNWNVYSGPWEAGPWFGIGDFRRVAVHELGHTLGLDHEDDVPAIMSSFVGDLEGPTADDIAGADALYPSDSGALDDPVNCPLVPNLPQTDTDGDGSIDACDPDDDGDGMPDGFETANGLDPLDAADAAEDADGDGLSNLEEFLAGTDPQDSDSDGDGVPDGFEAANGLDPLDPTDAAEDADADGLSNLEEFLAGTDPQNPDSDGDAMPDGFETANGLDPLDPADAAEDADGDGTSNLEEFLAGTDPNDPESGPGSAAMPWIDLLLLSD